MSRPLYGGCPLFGGSVIRGFTVRESTAIAFKHDHACYRGQIQKCSFFVISQSWHSYMLKVFVQKFGTIYKFGCKNVSNKCPNIAL